MTRKIISAEGGLMALMLAHLRHAELNISKKDLRNAYRPFEVK